MSIIESFTYLANKNAQILILGSMPGQKSLDENQYYAHPRNTFWKIMATIYNFDVELSYDERCDELSKSNIALWDVMQNCVRPGSLDSAIVNDSIIPNDFNDFFETYKGVKLIAFNGQKAAHTFKSKILKNLNLEIKTITLPSTSPAHASMSFEKKLDIWRGALEYSNSP